MTQQHQLLQSIHKESYLWSLCCCQYDEEMAKDVLQAAYLKFYEGKARFAGKSSMKTWFFSIIRYTAIDEFRKRKVTHLSLSHALEVAAPIFENSSEEQEKKQQFKKILKQLSTQQREILTLIFYNDLTIEDASKVLDISIGAARSHYSRAKANFKKHLTHSFKTKIKKG